MGPVRKLLRAVLRSSPVRRGVEFLVEDYLEANASSLALAIRSSVVNQTPGDYVEFGVHTGRSFIRAYRCYERAARELLAYGDLQPENRESLPLHMRFFAFDAFDLGFPEPSGVDGSELRPVLWNPGGMRTPQRDFVASCKKAGLNMDFVQVTPGYFADSLTRDAKVRLELERAAVIHFDCDLYQSTLEALHFSTSLIQLGTVLVFDDYFRFRGSEQHGEYRAFREWREANPRFGFREFNRHKAHSVAFICSRADAAA